MPCHDWGRQINKIFYTTFKDKPSFSLANPRNGCSPLLQNHLSILGRHPLLAEIWNWSFEIKVTLLRLAKQRKQVRLSHTRVPSKSFPLVPIGLKVLYSMITWFIKYLQSFLDWNFWSKRLKDRHRKLKKTPKRRKCHIRALCDGGGEMGLVSIFFTFLDVKH